MVNIILNFNLLIFLFIHNACSNNYSVLTLSQSWPQTSCWDINKKWQEVNAECTTCKLPQRSNNWTVHGLWPTNRHGIHPEFCEGGNSWGQNGIDTELHNLLSNKWPGFRFGFEYINFWKYQYKKHGTCISDIENTNTLKKYFLIAVKLLDQYNIGKIFENAGILPDSTFTFRKMSKVIQKIVGKNTYVKCYHDPISNRQYIRQIHICFEKSFELTHCSYETFYRMKTNCKVKEKIFYPRRLNRC
ncbi:PREDICTED: ribonuclease Oy-like [Ceratosolen solmsi marchali]|uniref:Ribonuclease Oy-like n=1 Tax=Ceratosolen solmsi marchali TaxID=326594 RepID=A0AAJ6VL52_9HYME|nr:PREDICTED: ribonuclease Oy-like [Ceratosolen solmsi marchali]